MCVILQHGCLLHCFSYFVELQMKDSGVTDDYTNRIKAQNKCTISVKIVLNMNCQTLQDSTGHLYSSLSPHEILSIVADCPRGAATSCMGATLQA